jgi:integrase
MRNSIHRLSARFVASTEKVGLHCDGGGLYLQITSPTARSWLLKFVSPVTGTVREMGLGSVDAVSLGDRQIFKPDGSLDRVLPGARTLAAQARNQVALGIDAIEQRKLDRAATAKAEVKTITFNKALDAYITQHEKSWHNPRHAGQWRSSLMQHASPVLGRIALRDIDTGLVMQVLSPIWSKIPETASRVRGRIESILDWGRVHGYRDEGVLNPAAWSGNLEHVLASRNGVVKHLESLDWRELPAFFTRLQAKCETVKAARALAFMILTNTWSGAVLEMKWDEVDGNVWEIPVENMMKRTKKPHRVPLTDAALQILATQAKLRTDDRVFAGEGKNGKLASVSMRKVLASMNVKATAHGFRATFKTWAGEQTNFANEIIEAAMAHEVGSKVEQAYQRSYFVKRAKLMQQWADYCTTLPVDADKVVTLLHKVG